MTTPGQQLTPGDDQNPPTFGVPEGAYVGTAGQSNSITDLNNLTEAEAKNRMRGQVAPSFNRQRNGVWGFFSLLGDAVGGVVQAVVGGIAGIFNAIGSLFSAGRRDTAAVDQARVAGENAIVANMSASLEHLDEVQRFGGAYMGYETFSIFEGELGVRVTPLSEMMPLEAGTAWIPPNWPLTHSAQHQYGRDESPARLARGSGQLELLESGLWIIYFQGAFRQGPAYPDRPVHMWCYVTPADSPWLPVGQPELDANGNAQPGNAMARHRDTGAYITNFSVANIAGFGRASAHTRDTQTAMGGGNTLFGMAFAYLETGGWKVSLSDMSFEKFGGAASTFLIAQKVNSETLRQDIDLLKDAIALSLPGENVPLDLDEDQIAAMVAQAGQIEVPEVEVPND